MRKSLVIILVLLNCQFVTMAQNWNLFPQGQYTLFELTFNNQPTVIERVVKDSTRLVNDSIIGYFNSRIINESECAVTYNLKKIYDRVPNYLQLDSTGEKNSWQYFNYYITNNFSNNYYQFKFNALARVKESWKINDRITFTCDSASQRMLFGQLDSVKYFSNSLITIPFVLSKTFGLIEFAPFRQLLDENELDVARVKQVGYEKEEMKKGFTVPDFSDFFHLNAKDVVIWHHPRTAWPPGELTDYYYKDSITHSIVTADSVIYEINRIQDNSITKVKQSFYRDQFSRFLNIHSVPGIITNVNPMGGKSFFFHYWGCPRMVWKDTIFSMYLMWGGLTIDPNNCNLYRLKDAGSYFIFDTRVGLSVDNSVKAEGSIINGEKWGITQIPTDISQVEDASFKVYPNPCSDKIMVQSTVVGKLDYKLFNSTGQLVKAGQVNNQTIEIASLPDGLYHLQLGNDRLQETKKLVKAGSRK